jgi:ribosomal protein S18 acetylase RimI-like enzyme
VSGTVVLADDARTALDAVGGFLRTEPVQNNLVLTLLEGRAEHPAPGRYAWVGDGDAIEGAVLQSPLDFQAVVSEMSAAAIDVVVDTLAGAWTGVPGVFGPAEPASRFAGRWAEVAKVPARPVEGQRLYLLATLDEPTNVPGTGRPASDDDLDLVLAWGRRFVEDTGGTVVSPDALRRRLGAGLIWIWEHDRPVAMASYTPAAAGVSRVGLVYTSREHRGHGYAAACTAAATVAALDAGAEHCVLYTQLHNPRSNAIYRRLGYRPVGEHLRYEFTDDTTGRASSTNP